MGIRKRRRGNAGIASWSDRGIKATGAAVRVLRAHFYGLQWGGGRQREAEKTLQPSVMVLKVETDRGKANALREFPPVSYERAKTVDEREPKQREHENAARISAGL